MNTNQVKTVLGEVANSYPERLQAAVAQEIQRISFNIMLSIDGLPLSTVRILDIGGGVGSFSVGCAALGVKESILLDDLNDPINKEIGNSVLEVHKKYKVTLLLQNVIERGLAGIDGTLDVITCFDSMEHWHHSPRKLLDEVMEKLRKGGRFVLAVPNCVNLRKRVTVPLGFGKWSAFDDWFNHDLFRGHVREPDVDDVLMISSPYAFAECQDTWEKLGRLFLSAAIRQNRNAAS